MIITPLTIPEVLLIEPKVFRDERGYFFESYQHRRFVEMTGQDPQWVQDNESQSVYGVLRGLHFQRPPMEMAKLVRVVRGAVLDVAVDIRPNSPTFGQHVAVELSAENKRQLFIPRGFAHGFLVLTETAIFSYKCDNYYPPEHDTGIYFADPDLGIDWKLPAEKLIISEKDKNLGRFANVAPLGLSKGEKI